MDQGRKEVAPLHKVGTVADEGSSVVEGSSAVEDSLHPYIGSH